MRSRQIPARGRARAAWLAACSAFLVSAATGLDEPQNYYAAWKNGPPADANYFPLAVWLQSPSNAPAYKAAGINLFVGLWDGPTGAQLSTLASAGMPVLCSQNTAFVNNATIRGWTQDDEPDNAQPDGSGGYGPPVAASAVIANYNAMRAKDSTRPVYLNLGQGVAWDGWYGRGVRTNHPEDYYEYVKGCDIASYDIYPVNSIDAEVSGKLWYVAQGVDRLRTYVGNAKPVWCWIECTRIDSGSPAKPTPAQVKSEVWMAIIHGANGIGYFCHSWYPSFVEAALLQDAAMLAAVKSINAQVTSLASVINSPTVTGKVTAASSNGAVPVDILVKQQGGATYVFAAAMRSGSTTGTFVLPAAAAVEVMGEGRQISASAGTFSDSFGSYGIHLYKCTPTSVGDRDPAVSFTAPAPGATVSGTLAANARANDPDAGTADGAGIQSVVFELLRDGRVLATHQENIVTYDWSVDTTAFADGTYVLRATAASTAAAGGTSSEAQVTLAFGNGLAVDRDADGDGLPDWWELRNGLNPNNADSDGDGTPDGNEDSDSDGILNIDECRMEAGLPPAGAPDGGDGGRRRCGSTGLDLLAPLALLWVWRRRSSVLRARR